MALPRPTNANPSASASGNVMPRALLCPSCNHAVTFDEEAAGTNILCPNCKAVCAAPQVPGDTQEDGWITAKAPRTAFSARPISDDPDEQPYGIADLDPDLSVQATAPAPTREHEAARKMTAAPEEVTGEPLKRRWETNASLRLRLGAFIAYET